jgi:hypothetical protein
MPQATKIASASDKLSGCYLNSFITTCYNNGIDNDKMVFLSITPPIVQALEKLRSFQETTTLEICDARDKDEKTSHVPQSTKSNAKGPEDVGFTTGTIAQTVDTGEPDLSNARIGNPISHHQIIEIARRMRTRGLQPHTLEMLLKGAKVYIAPPTVKPEPVTIELNCLSRSRLLIHFEDF